MSGVAPKFQRRGSALKNIAMKRSSINAVINLNALDISTHALFRVIGNNVRRVDLDEKVTDALRDPTDSGQEVRLLFRSWVSYKYGVYDSEVFQYGNRHKQANTALWLTFMEATFMTMTGKFYLTEDESLMLGCLKMQSESGDFRPAVHNVEIIKTRVANRFPNPIRSKMKALCSPTLSGSRAAEDLANRALAMYARVAGKSKVEAQLDYLECLRTWCPFYGSTFYDVQCQYDDNPLDANSTPPVISMNACIGPLAIFLITPTEPPVIMRHPYKRIIKWVTHPDKHIFTYWVIKPNISISDMEEYQEEHRGGDVDTRQFCDCVYLVTSQVRELEHLVKTYIEAVTDIPPSLPGATDELLPPKRVFDQILASEENSNNNSNQATQPEKIHEASDDDVEDRPAPQERKPVKSRLSVFFNALGGFDSPANNASNVTSGSGLANHEAVGGDEIYGDDTAGVNNSFFKGAYGRGSMVVEGNPDGDEDASINKIPNNVKYAASMSELKRLAEETEFSDHDDEDDDEDESEDDDDDSGKGGKSHPRGKGVKGNSEEDIPTQKLGGGVPSMTAFRRASRILFGGFQQQQPFSGKKPDGDEEGSESSSGAGSDDDGDSGDGAPRGNSSDDED